MVAWPIRRWDSEEQRATQLCATSCDLSTEERLFGQGRSVLSLEGGAGLRLTGGGCYCCCGGLCKSNRRQPCERGLLRRLRSKGHGRGGKRQAPARTMALLLEQLLWERKGKEMGRRMERTWTWYEARCC